MATLMGSGSGVDPNTIFSFLSQLYDKHPIISLIAFGIACFLFYKLGKARGIKLITPIGKIETGETAKPDGSTSKQTDRSDFTTKSMFLRICQMIPVNLKSLLISARSNELWLLLRNNCFVVSSDVDTYVRLATIVSETAETFLLWTLNSSPIKRTIGVDKDGLAGYDRKFAGMNARKKVRLVVFSDIEEAKDYCNQKNSNQVQGFMEAHSGNGTLLLFTIWRFLWKVWNLKKYEIELSCMPPDMGFVLNGKNVGDGLIFNSEFHMDKDALESTHNHKRTMFCSYNHTFSEEEKGHELAKFQPFYQILAQYLFAYQPDESIGRIFFKFDDLGDMCKKYDEQFPEN